MAQSNPTRMARIVEPITIKRYAGERLYNPGAASYVSLADLGDLVDDAEDFVVYDARTGEDVTQTVLRQIILERTHHG